MPQQQEQARLTPLIRILSHLPWRMRGRSEEFFYESSAISKYIGHVNINGLGGTIFCV